MDEKRINEQRKGLADKIGYKYKDLAHLKEAMDVTKVGNTSEPEYKCSRLALVGDAVLKTVISDMLYERGYSRGNITMKKATMENNQVFQKISARLDIYRYAYNEEYFFDEAPDEKRLPSGKHDVYVEAITGAVFHDLGYRKCCKWVRETIIPLLLC